MRGSQSSASDQRRLRDTTSVVGVEGSMLWGKRDEDAESVTTSIESKIFMNSSNDKLNWQFWEQMQLRED